MRSQQSIAEMWAGKWFSDNSHINDLSDGSLERAFENCVQPPHPNEYEAIRHEIERMAVDRGLLREGQLTLF